MKIIVSLLVIMVFLQGSTCVNSNNSIEPVYNNYASKNETIKMNITVGTTVFKCSLNNNASAAAFKNKLPLTIKMTELNRNEKYFKLEEDLPADEANTGTIQNGDLMLYGSRTIVLFYKSFATPYQYTTLGRMDNPAELAAALGPGDVTVSFALE